MSDTTPTPAPESDPVEADGKPARFAGYDTTYARFVGGVHDTAEDARAAAKDGGAKRASVREV